MVNKKKNLIAYLNEVNTCGKHVWSITAYLGPLSLIALYSLMDTFSGLSVDCLLELSVSSVLKLPPLEVTSNLFYMLRFPFLAKSFSVILLQL